MSIALPASYSVFVPAVVDKSLRIVSKPIITCPAGQSVTVLASSINNKQENLAWCYIFNANKDSGLLYFNYGSAANNTTSYHGYLFPGGQLRVDLAEALFVYADTVDVKIATTYVIRDPNYGQPTS